MSSLRHRRQHPLRRLNRHPIPVLFTPSFGKENRPEDPIQRFKSAMARVKLADQRVKEAVAHLHLVKARVDASAAKARAMLNRLKELANAKNGGCKVEKYLPRLHLQMDHSDKLSDHMTKIGDRVLKNLNYLEKQTTRAWNCAVLAEEAVAERERQLNLQAAM